MKRHSYILLPTIVSLLSFGTAHAQVVISEPPETTMFPEPAEYCFAQTSLHREYTEGGFNLRLNHHLIIANENQTKAGDIFVGARFKSNPDELWLLSGNIWRNAEDTTVNWPSVYYRFDNQLPPIVRVSLSYDPAMVGASGDGEILIGYGLRTESNPTPEAFQESFDEMVHSQRYSVLWEFKSEKKPFPGELHVEDSTICLKATQMERTVHKQL
ncbi:MAG: hypothetical protein WD071_11565 [Pseudohongiella sp.]|uniref:hypothetical protein n=1 Tax=Pseudohongiella sp. TaxID=1979412 RepID=UPI0034A0A07F